MRVPKLSFSILLSAHFVTLLLVTLPAAAQNDFTAHLSSLEEVPAIVSPAANGTFTAFLNVNEDLEYTLDYGATRGNVSQAHIHIAQEGVNGAIVLFLCTNLGNGPPATQACPESGPISGTLTPADVVKQANQGVDAFLGRTNLDRVIFALRRGAAYVNVHTDKFPGGEIRGQVLVD